ncbi:MAG: hypothetical protein ACMUEM_04490 [Flavobacteriales bacterium AspAUS03]
MSSEHDNGSVHTFLFLVIFNEEIISYFYHVKQIFDPGKGSVRLHRLQQHYGTPLLGKKNSV